MIVAKGEEHPLSGRPKSARHTLAVAQYSIYTLRSGRICCSGRAVIGAHLASSAVRNRGQRI